MSLGQNIDEVIVGRTDAEVTRKSGFGNYETARQARNVIATGAPELIAAMDSGAAHTGPDPPAPLKY